MPNIFSHPAARSAPRRLALVVRDHAQARRAAEWAKKSERSTGRASLLLFAGIAAALYVAARIGLTYAVLAH